METSTLKQTVLHEAHVKAGAKLVPFAGYEMPVQYTGLKAEHAAVRQNVGMFDVSHMGEFFIEGNDAKGGKHSAGRKHEARSILRPRARWTEMNLRGRVQEVMQRHRPTEGGACCTCDCARVLVTYLEYATAPPLMM